ncbi:MAG: cyanophycin synthetase, partial [Methanobrevibacter sp.]|nr:cyanophycin synthetase [Methanobrevibacter sp.]
IGLVNSIEEVFRETSGIVRATEKGGVVLNLDDENVLKMGDMVNQGVDTYYTSMDKDSIKSYDADEKSKVYFDDDRKAIIYDGEAILGYEELPFTSTHFIRNILSAISACISLAVPIEDIASGVKTYKPLSRRFTRLQDDPIIIDDFAHNPDGIKNTVRAASALVDELGKDNLHVVCAIRGSRGKTLNGLNAQALVEVIHDLRHETGRKLDLILSSSADVVDHLNFVNECERKVFMHHLDEGRIKYTHYEYLFDALSAVLESACENDVILLIGAQGMDPAEEVLNDIRGSN